MNFNIFTRRLGASGAIALFLLLGACGDIERGETTPPVAAADTGGPGPTTDGTSKPTTDTTGGTGLSFATDVHTILMAKCSSCHTATHGSAYKLSGDPAADFTNVSGLINKGAPDESTLLVRGSGTGHGGGAVLKADSAEYATVKEWITGGALP